MNALAAISSAIKMIQTAQELTDLASRAIEAANNGDDSVAEAYLANARQQYAKARKEWDNA